MRCLFCGIELALLRALEDGQFCCDYHRKTYETTWPFPETQDPPFPTLLALKAELGLRSGECDETRRNALLPVENIPQPILPFHSVQPDFTKAHELPALEDADGTTVPEYDVRTSPVWQTEIRRGYRPSLRVLSVALALAALGVLAANIHKSHSENPHVGRFQSMLHRQFAAARDIIAQRAAVQYLDDFRTGLDEWRGRANETAGWSYDAAGFLRPGALAIYQPTVNLTDYRFELFGEIEANGMGCVFRATDPDNYYAVKLIVAKPGPIPEVHLVRYAVIHGTKQRYSEVPLPISTRNDTLYLLQIDVRGHDFTIMAQGKLVDFFSDDHLERGGVGLFCGRGEKARVRWIEISHQYDVLGRLCAYLAPLNTPSLKNGNWN